MNILANDGTSDKVLRWCENNDYKITNTKIEQKDLVSYINDNKIDVLIVRIGTSVDRSILSCPSLRLVIRAGVGLDNIDLESAIELEVDVCNTPQSAGISVSELTFGLILSVCRNIHKGIPIGSDGFLEAKKPKGYELHGKTLGIIGYGRIGKKVALIAEAFGMKVLKYDKFNDIYNTKDEVISKSDILTLHCPFNEVIIGDVELKRMKMKSIIINAGRGGLIDERALINNIDKFIGVGLDTYIGEPDINPFFLLHDKFVTTPHIGSQTHGCQNRIGDEVIEILSSYI